MATLLDTIQGYLSPNIVTAAAAELGESESGVSKAIIGLASTILAGAMSKANDEYALDGLFNKLSDRDNIGFLHNLAGSVAGGNLARNDPKDVAGAFVGSLFGDKVGGILNAINSFANLKTGSSSSLLGLAGPLVMGVLGMGVLGKNIQERGLDAIGLKKGC